MAVLFLLATLAVSFAHITRLERSAASHQVAEARAELLARAGLELARARLTEDLSRRAILDVRGAWHFRGNSVTGPGEGVDLADAPFPSFALAGAPKPSSGVLGGSFAGGGDHFVVKVIDVSSQIDLNLERKSLETVLRALGRAILSREDERLFDRNVVDELFEYRENLPGEIFTSKAQVRDAIGEESYRVIEDYVTVHGIAEPTLRLPSPVRDYPRGYDEITPERLVAVNVNTASVPVLTAVMRRVDANTLCLRDEFRVLRDGTRAVRIRYHRSRGLNSRESGALAEWIARRRQEVGPFYTRQELRTALLTEAVVEGALGDEKLGFDEASALVANAETKIVPNSYYPDAALRFLADRGNLEDRTVPFCLAPRGLFEIESIGRVLGPDDRVLAEVRHRRVIRLFVSLVQSTQAEFVAARVESDERLVSVPEPLEALEQALGGRDEDYASRAAGAITLAPPEVSSPASAVADPDAASSTAAIPVRVLELQADASGLGTAAINQALVQLGINSGDVLSAGSNLASFTGELVEQVGPAASGPPPESTLRVVRVNVSHTVPALDSLTGEPVLDPESGEPTTEEVMSSADVSVAIPLDVIDETEVPAAALEDVAEAVRDLSDGRSAGQRVGDQAVRDTVQLGRDAFPMEVFFAPFTTDFDAAPGGPATTDRVVERLEDAGEGDLSHDGVLSYPERPRELSYQPSSVPFLEGAIEFWMKLGVDADRGSDEVLLYTKRRDPNPPASPAFTGIAWRLERYGSSLISTRFYFGHPQGARSPFRLAFSERIADISAFLPGEWHHVAVRWDEGVDQILYLDGIASPVGVELIPRNPGRGQDGGDHIVLFRLSSNDPVEDFQVGGYVFQNPAAVEIFQTHQFLAGSINRLSHTVIDDVRVYDRASIFPDGAGGFPPLSRHEIFSDDPATFTAVFALPDSLGAGSFDRASVRLGTMAWTQSFPRQVSGPNSSGNGFVREDLDRNDLPIRFTYRFGEDGPEQELPAEFADGRGGGPIVGTGSPFTYTAEFQNPEDRVPLNVTQALEEIRLTVFLPARIIEEVP